MTPATRTPAAGGGAGPAPGRAGAGTRALRIVWALSAVAALWWSLGGLEVTPERLSRGLPQAGTIIRQMFTPPNWAYLPDVAEGLSQSVQIAALGTFIAAVLALPFGALAARNLSRLAALPLVGKLALNVIRTFPELVLALLFIRAVGPGPFAGVLAVGIHSIGMVGKLYAERIETVDRASLEALSASGASPLEVFRYGVVPEVLPDFLSFALYRFDLNVRAATVLGLVGAGGIGEKIQIMRTAQQWPSVGTILIGVIVLVGLVDYVSARLRARLT